VNSGPTDEDARLALLARSGDRQAFHRLLLRLMPRLIAAIRTAGVEPSEVDDVVQDASLAIWRGLGGYDAEQPVAPWTAVIAINKARDWRRRRKSRAAWLGASQLDYSLPDATPGPQDQALDRVALDRARRAINALPNSLRLPLQMTAILGFSQTETAAALGVSVKAVELRIARARDKLRQTLGGDGSGEA
jgi:RNA polymerase sigma factor (sigma-70 family)